MRLKNTLLQGSIMRRLIVQATALTGLTIVVLALLSLLIARSLVRKSLLSEIGTLSSVAEETIEKSLGDARERTVRLSSDRDLHAMILEDARENDERAWELVLGMSEDALPVLGMTARAQENGIAVHIGQDIPANTREGADTRVVPFVTDAGMTVFDVYTPVRGESGAIIGSLSMRYDASLVLSKLASLSLALGHTGEVMLSFPKGGDAFVFRPSTDVREFSILRLAKDVDTPTVRALAGKEGVAETTDDEGFDVFAAYRFLPDIGWGFSMTVESGEAFAEVSALSRLIGVIGFFLLILAGIVGVALSRTITRPLRSLADKVKGLEPGRWEVVRTVHTQDEVEVLDRVVVDMATRLKKVYDDMEGVIRERTLELAEQYALDRAILENISYAVIAVDSAGMITDTNPAAVQILGKTSEEMKGKSVADIVQFRSHQGNTLIEKHPVMQCLAENAVVHSPANAHWNIQKPDASLVPISCSISPLRDKGNVFGAILVLQDVSEERRLDYLKSEFITLASHQLRTPLSALRWYTELMGEEGTLSEDQKGYVKEMGISLGRMANLLDSLLRASQMEEDGLGVALSDVDVNKLLSETDEDFRSIAQEKDITFSVSLPETSVTAHSDPTLLRIVLQNLLSNAVKYTRKDSHIALELAAKGERFAITVTDEGLGIPEAEQGRVFQKFFRAKNVRQIDTDGNGLGLYITKSIVERLGGTIDFTSKEGKGTTFAVTFPLLSAAKEKEKSA